MLIFEKPQDTIIRQQQIIDRQKTEITALQMENGLLQSNVILSTQNYEHIKEKWCESREVIYRQTDRFLNTYKELQAAKAEIERLSDLFREVTQKTKSEAIKEVAKFLIDNRKNGIIAIDDLCDYVKEKTDFNPYDFSKMFLNCGELKPINTEIAGESNGEKIHNSEKETHQKQKIQRQM